MQSNGWRHCFGVGVTTRSVLLSLLCTHWLRNEKVLNWMTQEAARKKWVCLWLVDTVSAECPLAAGTFNRSHTDSSSDRNIQRGRQTGRRHERPPQPSISTVIVTKYNVLAHTLCTKVKQDNKPIMVKNCGCQVG